MSTFNRLFDLAAKALDKTGSSTPPAPGAPAARGGGDWRSAVRAAAETLTGDAQRRPAPSTTPPPAPGAARPGAAAAASAPAVGAADAAEGAPDAADRAAIARYDYLMQTADPHQIERIHQEAFARLSPAQRAQIEARMRAELPPYQQPASAAPGDLARAAARSEAMQPGRMRGLLARSGGGRSALAGAGMAAGGMLGVVAGGAVLSTVAAPLLEQAAGFGVDFDAIASGIDLDTLTGGALDTLTGGALDTAGEQLSGVGEQVSGWGDALPDLGLPGLGDLFGR